MVDQQYNIKVAQALEDISTEVCRAKEIYPQNFVNLHEAYAVILEEVDELWAEIKKNQKVCDLEKQRDEAK
jgi:NTP pyrophosphatase (non-canonical NTP hydrolase)